MNDIIPLFCEIDGFILPFGCQPVVKSTRHIDNSGVLIQR